MIAQNRCLEPATCCYARVGDRGFSNAAYPLLYVDRLNDQLFYILDLSTDSHITMPKGFQEADVLPVEREPVVNFEHALVS